MRDKEKFILMDGKKRLSDKNKKSEWDNKKAWDTWKERGILI